MFRDRLNELFMQYPGTEVARKAVSRHIGEVKEFVNVVVAAAKNGMDLSQAAPLAAPPFPEAGKNGDVPADTIPTYAYNWCVSPMTPMAVAGVVWVPSENNIGYDAAQYAAEITHNNSYRIFRHNFLDATDDVTDTIVTAFVIDIHLLGLPVATVHHVQITLIIRR